MASLLHALRPGGRAAPQLTRGIAVGGGSPLVDTGDAPFWLFAVLLAVGLAVAGIRRRQAHLHT